VLPEAFDGGFTKLTVKAEFFLLFDYRPSWTPKSGLPITGVNQYKLLIQSPHKASMYASGLVLAITSHCRYFLCIAESPLPCRASWESY